MKIPKRRNVFGTVYKTAYKWRLQDDSGHLCEGLCDLDEKIIYLDRSVPETKRAQVYLHEELHAVIFELGLHLTSLSSDAEEVLVQGIARHILETYSLREQK